MGGGGLCLKVKPNYIVLDFVLDLAAVVLVVIVVVSPLEFFSKEWCARCTNSVLPGWHLILYRMESSGKPPPRK